MVKNCLRLGFLAFLMFLFAGSAHAQAVIGNSCPASGQNAITANGTPVVCTGSPLVWTAVGSGSGGLTSVSSLPATCTPGTTGNVQISVGITYLGVAYPVGTEFFCDSTNHWSSIVGIAKVNTNAAIANGLVADWRFLEGSGTTIADSSGNGNGLTFCGTGPSWLSPGPGVRFNGTTQCIQLPSSMPAILGANPAGATVQMLLYFGSNDGTLANFAASSNKLCLLCSNGNGSSAHAGGIVLSSPTGLNTANDTVFTVLGIATQAGPSSFQVWQDTQAVFQGTGVVTYVSIPAVQDTEYINGKQMSTGSFVGNFASGAPFTGNFFIGYPATGFAFTTSAPAMNVYRMLIYNRQLTAAEIAFNSNAMNYFAGQTSIIPTVPCCIGALNQGSNNSNDTQDQDVLFTDSVFITNNTGWMSRMVFNGGPWNLINAAEVGNGASQFISSSPYSEDSMFRPFGGKNIMFFCYGNDLNGGTAAATFQKYQLVGIRALSAGWTPAFCTIPTRTAGGFDAVRDAFNTSMRSNCPNIVWCPMLFDIAADLNLGPDGNGVNTTYFADGTHLTANSLNNNVPLIVQRQTNRWYGNKTWSTANTYTASGTNTIATTNATEATNTVTITVGAVGPCVAGSEVTVAGITPAGYNGQFFISANTATTITYYNFTTGLGAQSVAGTIHCPQQLDADDHLILGGAGAAQTFFLESCIGQVQPTYILVTNTNASPWVLTPWTSSETINGAATMNAPVAVATNNPVVALEPIFSGSVTAGCTWKAHIQ